MITWATPAAIVYGTALERDAAERDGERAGHVRLHAGERHGAQRGRGQTLSVTFTPTDAANYTTRRRASLITVRKATPAITWATPADIVYGTALERDAAERDGDACRARSSTRRRRHGA